MAKIDTTTLFRLWVEKEQREGRRITIKEVAEATEISVDAISNLRSNTTTRFDAIVLIALCEYFDVPSGTPVPFIVFEREAVK